MFTKWCLWQKGVCSFSPSQRLHTQVAKCLRSLWWGHSQEASLDMTKNPPVKATDRKWSCLALETLWWHHSPCLQLIAKISLVLAIALILLNVSCRPPSFSLWSAATPAGSPAPLNQWFVGQSKLPWGVLDGDWPAVRVKGETRPDWQTHSLAPAVDNLRVPPWLMSHGQ